MSYTKSPYVVTVLTTAKELADPTTPAGVAIRARLIRNLSTTVTAYLGGSDVTANTTKGWALAPGETFSDSLSNGPMHAITDSTANIQVWEVIN